MDRLPIDDVLPAVLAVCRRERRLVLEAPPGAGKTTRVPVALLDAGISGAGGVLVVEPRRLAARSAARRVASERGERVGETIGHQVRFDDATGPRTRVRYVTEGILARRLVADPTLVGVGAVLLDEFHERRLASDVALARLLRLTEGARKDLVVGAMSATLDTAALVARMGAGALVRSEGRAFPVAIDHAPVRDERPLERRVAAAVGAALAAEPAGDVLVFLPGAAEIRRATDALAAVAAARGAALLPLHGDLSPEEQDRALAKGPRRRVVLATNVAETSVTVEGVTVVVDAGLARIPRVDPWSGLVELRVEPVARDAAAQRAGRAGRTAPGRCVRLYTKADHDARPATGVPEVRRLDLAETALELHAAGERDLGAFPWFEAPPASALTAADDLLRRLGAVGDDGVVTRVGRAMLELPLPPRLARLVTAAVDLGIPGEGAAAAALLAERDLLRGAGPGGRGRARGPHGDAASSDLLPRLDALDDAIAARFEPGRAWAAGIDPNAARHAARATAQLQGLLRGPRTPRPSDPDEALRLAVLAAYPDRIAARRAPGSRELVLGRGGVATLAEESVVTDAPFLVALVAEERARGGPLVRIASAVSPEDLVEHHAERLKEETVVRWVAEGERVEAVRRLVFEGIALEERRVAPSEAPEAAERLAVEALRAGPEAFVEAGAVERLLARTAFVATLAPAAIPAPPDEELVREVLRGLCAGRASFDEVRRAGLLDAVRDRLSPAGRAALERLAPDRVALHAGWSPRVEYARGRPPWIEARLQDFFGLAKGPSVGGGAVPVTLHLLGPNRRPVQVTSDLAGFWARHYPAVRRELSRRYPRHAWPEDPLTAAPPAR